MACMMVIIMHNYALVRNLCGFFLSTYTSLMWRHTVSHWFLFSKGSNVSFQFWYLLIKVLCLFVFLLVLYFHGCLNLTQRFWQLFLKNPILAKGQVISERNFGLLNFPKNKKRFVRISVLGSKMGGIKKMKALYYIN